MYRLDKMSVLKHSLAVCVLAVCVFLYTKVTEVKLPLVFGGTVLPEFQEVSDLFKSNLEKGYEKGASFSVYYKGEALVDIWGGYADIDALRPWKEDTLSIIYSSTKGVTAILVALFVDRGWLDYDKPVSHYWPEFSKNGKENITVGILLSHQGGLSVTNGSIPLQWVEKQPKKVQQFLESQRPVWAPGTGFAYHTITYGLYVDVLLQKADPKHRGVTQIFQEEIGKKFGIEMYHSLPNSKFYRAARHTPNPFSTYLWNVITSFDVNAWYLLYMVSFNPGSLFMQSTRALDVPSSPLYFNSPDFNRIAVSSFTGYSNARNLAKLYDIVANGGKTKSETLLSEKTVALLNQQITSNRSLDTLVNVNFGYGVFVLNNEKGERLIGHPGYGGQTAFADMTNKLGIAYITSRLKAFTLGDDKEYIQYRTAFYRGFEKYLQKRR